MTPPLPRPPLLLPPCRQRCPCETRRTARDNGREREKIELKRFLDRSTLRDFFFFFFYLHRVDDDGESGVVPLAAALLRAAPGTFATSMDRANSEHAEDHHDHQETHAHHDDDGGCSRHH